MWSESTSPLYFAQLRFFFFDKLRKYRVTFACVFIIVVLFTIFPCHFGGSKSNFRWRIEAYFISATGSNDHSLLLSVLLCTFEFFTAFQSSIPAVSCLHFLVHPPPLPPCKQLLCLPWMPFCNSWLSPQLEAGGSQQVRGHFLSIALPERKQPGTGWEGSCPSSLFVA